MKKLIIICLMLIGTAQAQVSTLWSDVEITVGNVLSGTEEMFSESVILTHNGTLSPKSISIMSLGSRAFAIAGTPKKVADLNVVGKLCPLYERNFHDGKADLYGKAFLVESTNFITIRLVYDDSNATIMFSVDKSDYTMTNLKSD